jgi:hypothetical protein
MATTTKDKTARARVLVDCPALGVKAGQVIEAAPDVIKAHPGELDDNEAAVTYALQEGGGKVVAYPPAAAEKPAAGG